MQTLERSGVQFDMCPSCRGVWLDRGELEKLMEAAGAEGRASPPQAAPPPQAPQPAQQPWGGGHPQQPQYRDDRYRSDDDYRYKKKKRMDIFDIFD
ncbi:MAG: zf-TFIIB domain-containing protein [Brevundimonas sp.]